MIGHTENGAPSAPEITAMIEARHEDGDYYGTLTLRGPGLAFVVELTIDELIDLAAGARDAAIILTAAIAQSSTVVPFVPRIVPAQSAGDAA